MRQIGWSCRRGRGQSWKQWAAILILVLISLPAWGGAGAHGAWNTQQLIDPASYANSGQSDSLNLLSRCWSIAELRGSLQDAKVQDHLAPDISGPAKADIRRAEISWARLAGGVLECYEKKPGDNQKYDRLFGRGTGE